MTLLDRIKKMVGLTDSNRDAVNQVGPAGAGRADVTARSEAVTDEPTDLSSDLPKKPDTEPYEPRS